MLLACTGATALESELRATMRDFASSLSALIEASTHEPLAGTAAQRERINAALAVISEHAELMVQHLEREDTAFLAAALAKQMRILRMAAKMGDAPTFNQTLDRTVGACVGCHARTSRASGSRLATRLIPPEQEARLPVLRRARLQVATRRFEAARATLEVAMDSEQGAARMDAIRDYLALGLRILPDPAATLARLDALAATTPDPEGQLASWRHSLERWIAQQPADGKADLERGRAALARARAGQDADHARVDYLLAMNEAEHWLERGIGTDDDAAAAYLILGIGENALMPASWLPLPELYLEQVIWLAPTSASARDALEVLEKVLARRFPADDGMPAEVADHLRALRRMVGESG